MGSSPSFHTTPYQQRSGRYAAWAWPWAAAVLSAAVFTRQHLIGIKVTPDGWGYWQAAISIAEGHGYRYFSGEPMVTWPPLYPLYLAAWAGVAGPTSVSVAFANGVLIATQAGLWCWCLLAIWRHTQPSPSWSGGASVAAFVALFLPLHQYFVRADLLLYALLAPTVYWSWRTAVGAPESRVRCAAMCALWAALMVGTHHRGVLFAAAAAVMAATPALTRQGARLAATGLAAIVLAPPVATWLALRAWFDQWDSHLTGIGSPRETMLDYLRQFVHSVGDQLSSFAPITPRWAVAALLAAMLLVAARRLASAPLAFTGGFAFIAAVLTFAVFNLTLLQDDIDGRFVLFVPLLLVPQLLLVADRLGRAWLLTAATVILVPMTMATAVAIRTADATDPAAPGEIVIHTAEISTAYPVGPPVPTPRGRLVAPDVWQEPDEHARSRRRDR